ncbi:hypothetical protein ACIPEN_14290 [Herbaspirillum chlorophenolicum]|uniref:Uncharacterized protein n=1 Tax=Herbaspirillum chlorophenolicum TaxID=211589 RepID=A0ABW8F136_9BURK
MENSREIALNSYSMLMQMVINVIDAIAGKPIPADDEALNNAQVLGIKFLRHAVVVRSLYDGSTLDHEGPTPIQFIDFSSIMVVTRAALETFLVWHYLFGKSDSSEARFRFLTWNLGGLMDRQKHKALGEHGSNVQAQEKLEAERLQQELKTHPHFAKYKQKQQTKLLSGDWKIVVGSGGLAASAGMHRSYFENIYNLLCGHSHASYISVLQVRDAQPRAHQEALAFMCIGVMNTLMAHFAMQYPVRFPDVQAVIDADEEGKLAIERWSFTVEDWNRIYGEAQPRDPQS